MRAHHDDWVKKVGAVYQKLVAVDKAVTRARGARPAGEAEPQRKPRRAGPR